MDLSSDRILNHRKHRADEGYVAPARTKKDLAVLVRDRVLEQVEDESMDIMDPRAQAAIGSGLKAQALLDKREQQQKKHTQADALVALLGALRGESYTPPMLDDGMTIEGEAHEVD